jgi:NADH-quinone oxidoreductase subunit M
VDSESAAIQPRWEVAYSWLDYSNAEGKTVRLEWMLGMDGISLTLVLLTTLLTSISILASWNSIKDRATEFFACILLLETGMIGVFCVFDLLLFYVFFESTLIPLFFLVGIWGGSDCRRAAFRFFIYTLVGGLISLAGLAWLVSIMISGGHTSSPFSMVEIARVLQQHPLSSTEQIALFLLISTGFAVKVPLIPFHTWLPLAHVEAPTAGSVLLASILLKLGTYGFLRICLPFFPQACVEVGIPLIGTLSVIGIIYGALAALVQKDIKRLVAYSSISHLGFCMLGMFALNAQGITGSVFQMINHGLSTGGLFLVVGMIYERYHTRQLQDLGGLAVRLPLLTACLVLLCLSSVGLPGLNGFVGEFLCLAGMFKTNWHLATVGVIGVILGAWYLLTMLQHAFFGELREPASAENNIRDLSLREAIVLVPILICCVYIGVRPQPIADVVASDVQRIVQVYETESISKPKAVASNLE